MKYGNSEHLDLLCGEYVLGTLKGRARRRFERLLVERSDLRERLEEWDMRLNGLAEEASPTTPSPAAWESIVARIGPTSEAAATGARTPAPTRLSLWRALALGSSVTAAVLAVLLVTASLNPIENPGFVVMLRDASESPVWVINAEPAANELRIRTTATTDVPEGKRCYLWLQPPGSNEPYRVGVLPDFGEATLRVPASISGLMPGRLLVSLEDDATPVGNAPADVIEIHDEWLTPMASRI